MLAQTGLLGQRARAVIPSWLAKRTSDAGMILKA